MAAELTNCHRPKWVCVPASAVAVIRLVVTCQRSLKARACLRIEEPAMACEKRRQVLGHAFCSVAHLGIGLRNLQQAHDLGVRRSVEVGEP